MTCYYLFMSLSGLIVTAWQCELCLPFDVRFDNLCLFSETRAFLGALSLQTILQLAALAA